MGDEVEGPSGSTQLSKAGRRASISMPQGLDLLLKIAEYSWQAKPPLNSSFDDLAEAGVADACPSPIPGSRRRIGQVNSPNINVLNYDPVQSPEDSEGSSGSDGCPTRRFVAPPTPPTSLRRGRVGVSLAPAPKDSSSRVLKKKKSKNTELDDDTEIVLKPLAARRNSGILPLKIIDSNYLKSDPTDDSTDEESNKGEAVEPTAPPPPATGIHKITGRIKTKLNSMPLPKVFQKSKRPKEYKLQIFVAILFLLIILLVGTISVIHQEKELQKSYFGRIRFSSKDRRIRVANSKGRDIISGKLGVNLSKKDKAWPCLPEHQREGHTCLEWMDTARLYFGSQPESSGSLGQADFSSSSSSSSLRCYEIYWKSLDADFELKDCFSLNDKWGGHFYGGGEIPGTNHWPLNKTRVPYSPFLTGNKISDAEGNFQWGRTLRRFFLNSDGAALKVTEETPLHVSINADGDKKLCIGSRSAGYDYEASISALDAGGNKSSEGGSRRLTTAAYVPQPMRKKIPLHLNYTICTADNALETAELLADKNIGEGLRHENFHLTKFLSRTTIWRIAPEIIRHGRASEAALLNYTDRITALKLFDNKDNKSFILLDESWQQTIGDFEMDPTRFPNIEETLKIIDRRGFKATLTLQPFFSTHSKNYEDGLSFEGRDGGVWLAEKHPEKKRVPALTQYKNWTSVAVLDITKGSAKRWLEEKVTALTQKYKIEALYLDLGTTYDLPQFYEFSRPLSSSDYYKDLFLKTVQSIQHVKTIGVSTAVKLPNLPTFVSMSRIESSWEGLQSVIPNILTMGVAGFPFIMPGSIGGDFFGPNSTSYRTSRKEAFRVPDRELYIRWLQLVHFLPMVQYSTLPSDYDQAVIDIATDMYNTRRGILLPYMKKAIDEALTTGLPIIRPLWMIDPMDANCLKVSDEFSIGSDIIVAPLLMAGEEERDIYLPKGIWREMDDIPTKGEKWLHNYKVKENKIPFFTKIPDSSGQGGGGQL